MRRHAQTIALGGQSWSIRPLTLAQVRDIEPILVAQGTGGTVAAAMEVIAIALARDNANAVEALPAVEATAPEVATALATVLRLGGFIAPDESDSGEAQVAAGTDATA